MWISPRYQDSDFCTPLEVEDKILVFLDRTLGWQLDIAESCLKIVQNSEFAVLNIILSYFEMIAKYQDGFTKTGRSQYYFKRGLFSVFPQLKDEPQDLVYGLLDLLYFGCRCGLYHGGITESSVVISKDNPYPLVFLKEEPRLILNPNMLVSALKRHLAEYGRQLQAAKNFTLRRKFTRRFDFEALYNRVDAKKKQKNSDKK